MKSWKWLALALFCGTAIIAAGCANNDDIRANINSLQTETYSLQNEVQALEGNLQNSKKSSSAQNEALSTIRTSQAGVLDQLSTMQNNIDALRGGLDNEKHFTQTTLADVSSETSALANRVNQMQTSLDAQNQRVGALESEIKQMQTRTQAAIANASQPRRTASTIYDSAYTDFKNKNYPAARKGFTDFLNKYPEDPLAGNAQFWIAETYYAQKQYDQAILSYEAVLKNFPGTR
ncbi:MAG: tetratricopeptide repeat protein [Nitrospiraceae bacterium]|nr:tetratricopeptide repeat protein [Nitrospiraceae bacterium]